MTDPEDILYESSQVLYGHSPVAYSSANSVFNYIPPSGGTSVTVLTPDTQAANWSLHATSIWSSAIYIANSIEEFRLEYHYGLIKHEDRPLRVLELGAGAGLPSILIAKMYSFTLVTCSDYPDELLISSLMENASRNNVEDRCRVVPYAWGSDPSPLLQSQNAESDPIPGFDVVIAADTLWNGDTHQVFIQSLQNTLKRCPHSRIYLVAGFHTGPYVIHNFFQRVLGTGIFPEEVKEKWASGSGESEREWWPDRVEDERARRQWVVCAVLRWCPALTLGADPSLQ